MVISDCPNKVWPIIGEQRLKLFASITARLLFFRELIYQYLIAPFRPHLLDQAILNSIEVVFRPVYFSSRSGNAQEFAQMGASRRMPLCDKVAFGGDQFDRHMNIWNPRKDGSSVGLLAVRADGRPTCRQVQGRLWRKDLIHGVDNVLVFEFFSKACGNCLVRL
jgi:hypothetical protein